MPAFIDLTGQRYGRLVAQECVGRDRHGKVKYRCACDCGGTIETLTCSLRAGLTRSCGCMRAEAGRRMVEINRQRRWMVVA